MAKSEDIRPKQAIPAEGQTTHEGWAGFIPADKFSNQGSKPWDRDEYYKSFTGGAPVALEK